MSIPSYLQLYLDTDYILPIAVGVDGNLVKFQNQQGDSRLWLYFSKVAGRDVYESGPNQKANYEAKREWVYGDFWKHLDENDNVGNAPFTYIELLEVANLLDTLRNWCKPVLGTATPDVVLNFATTISIKARRALVDYLKKKGFSIRSYSIELNDLVAEKVSFDHRSTMHLAFGDQLLVLQSTGEQILLSTMTWCGDRFMQGDKPKQLLKQGDDFIKFSLAKMVVEKMEQYNNLLNPSEKQNEVLFQMQFTDEWLKNRDGNSIRVKGFYYSNDPSQIQPSVLIDAHQLDLLVEANSRETTNLIASYYRENIINNHLHTIFFGDVFRDELFLNNCIEVTSSQNKFTFFNDNALQEAMGRFFYIYGNINEPEEELERRYITMEQERERIRKYVKNAETLASLQTAIEKSNQEVCQAIENLKSRTSDIEDSWKSYMTASKFDEAEKALSRMSTDDTLTVALSRLFDTLAKIEAHTSLLTDLKQMNEVHVKEIVDKIEHGFEDLQQLQQDAKQLEIRPKTLLERTQHYRDVYGIYLDYKRRLNNEPSLGGKRRVLNEMKDQDLTMEPMPIVEVETISVELTYTIEEKKSGFLGLKKEKILKVSMQVKNGDKLPFPCVLQITDSNQINLNRKGWYADLNAGENHFEKSILMSELPKSANNSLVMQIFPNEQHCHLMSSIDCDSKRIRL